MGFARKAIRIGTGALNVDDGASTSQVADTGGFHVLGNVRGLDLLGRVGTDEVWATDGTRDGTKLIADKPGRSYEEIEEKVLYLYDDFVLGMEPHELTLNEAVSFRQTELLSVPENGELRVPVALAAAPASDVVVRITVSDSTRAEVMAEELTFSPEDWFEDREAVINGLNDLSVSGDSNLTLTAEVIDAKSDENYHGLSTSTRLVVTEVSTTPELRDGIITIDGTEYDDLVTAQTVGSNISVAMNGAEFLFPEASVSGLVIHLGNGNDRAHIVAAVSSAIRGGTGDDSILSGRLLMNFVEGAGNDTLFSGDGNDSLYGGPGKDVHSGGAGKDKLRGGPGNDTIGGGTGKDDIKGGSGADILLGGEGNDRIVGGNGADIMIGHDGLDTLLGGRGRDILFAGSGVDSLRGGNDQDILIGGNSNQLDETQLKAIRDEWNSDRSYPQRVANIRSGELEDRLNGDAFLKAGETVTSNNSLDELFGLGAKDWFFGDRFDSYPDRTDSEEVDLL